MATPKGILSSFLSFLFLFLIYVVSWGNCFLSLLDLALGTQQDGLSPSQPSKPVETAPGDCWDKASTTALVWSHLTSLEKALLAVNPNILCYSFSPWLLVFLADMENRLLLYSCCPVL